MSGVFPIIDQLAGAGSQQERAGMLLRLSDGIVYQYGGEIAAWCAKNGFAGGANYVAFRLSAILRVRDAHGMLPTYVAQQLELDREVMSRFAAGGLQLHD